MEWMQVGESESGEGKRRGIEVKRESQRAVARDFGIAREWIHRHFLSGHFAQPIAMKFLHILAIVSALFMVFGAVAPSTHADDKFAAAHGPLRLKLIAYDGDPKKKAPEKLSFQINTIDLKERSEFLKLGERIANTKWKLVKFEYKTRLNPISDELEDVSELTITDIETKRDVVLIFLRTTNVAAPVN